MTHSDVVALRDRLRALPDDVSHSAASPPDPLEIYTPRLHERALDPDRQLVIGGRGAGKSFWSGALASPDARARIAQAYPRLALDSVEVVPGFTGERGGPTPPDAIEQQLSREVPPETIWQAVLLRALSGLSNQSRARTLAETVAWIREDVERFDVALVAADRALQQDRRRLIIVFDALDRVAKDWPAIRRLTRELLRLALELRAFRSIRLKIFLRQDLADDPEIIRFVDSSKLLAERVELTWRVEDLYGLLYFHLWQGAASRDAFASVLRLARVRADASQPASPLPAELKSDADAQARVFARIAGPYMGHGPRRGRTYAWIPNHLADGRGFVSPRSFLTLIKQAAEAAQDTTPTPIDFRGIQAGLQEASQLRVRQLQDEYPWIEDALRPLDGMQVPNLEGAFIERWQEDKIVQAIRRKARPRATATVAYLVPIELADNSSVPEQRLLEALLKIGVLERRHDERVNMPDIFRIAAQLLRRGGVRPRGSP